MTRILKRFAPTGAFDFFTYLELLWWFVFCIVINPFRWKWALFVFTGRGSQLPRRVVQSEERARERIYGSDDMVNGEDYDVGRSF